MRCDPSSVSIPWEDPSRNCSAAVDTGLESTGLLDYSRRNLGSKSPSTLLPDLISKVFLAPSEGCRLRNQTSCTDPSLPLIPKRQDKPLASPSHRAGTALPKRLWGSGTCPDFLKAVHFLAPQICGAMGGCFSPAGAAVWEQPHHSSL